MRVHVTGNAASGKTTLARDLARALDLPFHSVDSVIWLPGWKQPPKDERNAAIQALGEQPTWVIDGVATSLRERADLVIVLDVPAAVCAFRALRRCLRYGRASRAGAAISADAAQAPEKYRVLPWPPRPEEGAPELTQWIREKMRQLISMENPGEFWASSSFAVTDVDASGLLGSREIVLQIDPDG